MYVEELKNSKEWESFLRSSPEGTFFHSLKWREVIEKSYSYSPLYLTIRNQDEKIVGVCPGFILNSMNFKIYHSLPNSDYGGPIIEAHCLETASIALRSFLQSTCASKGVTYAKICFTNNEMGRSFTSKSGCIETNKGVVAIDLKATPSDFIWRSVFSKNRRSKIKRVEREGFQVQEAKTKSDLRDFYNLYHENMTGIGATPYTYKFMENLWDVLYPENLRIWLVEKERQRVAGIAVLKDEQRTYWVYAGIDRKKSGNRSMIPYLIWKEIKKAEEEKRRYVSLGGTPSDPTHPYHVEKNRLGGTFYPQEIVLYPLTAVGHMMLQTRAKIVVGWKAINKFLPGGLRKDLERRLSKL